MEGKRGKREEKERKSHFYLRFRDGLVECLYKISSAHPKTNKKTNTIFAYGHYRRNWKIVKSQTLTRVISQLFINNLLSPPQYRNHVRISQL